VTSSDRRELIRLPLISGRCRGSVRTDFGASSSIIFRPPIDKPNNTRCCKTAARWNVPKPSLIMNRHEARKLYDRTREELSFEQVERIKIYAYVARFSQRDHAAAYVNFAQPSGHGFWWVGDKFRLRGRLFDEETLPVDLGWYAELEWHKTPSSTTPTLS
jgi:hypothetical protein